MTIDYAKLHVGDKVHYQQADGKTQRENGIIKEVREDQTDGVWVVYYCAGDWDNYKNYTGVLTYLRNLKLGWKP